MSDATVITPFYVPYISFFQLRGNPHQTAIRAKGKAHEHEFGDEQYDESSGDYRKQCAECGYEMHYEKL